MKKDLGIYTWETNSHALHTVFHSVWNITLLGYLDPLVHIKKCNLIKIILYSFKSTELLTVRTGTQSQIFVFQVPLHHISN